jgi:DNA-binding beta-propeller fold protein YncE
VSSDGSDPSSVGTGCYFNFPTGIASDDNEATLYVVDSANNAVKSIDLTNNNWVVSVVVADPILDYPYGIVVYGSDLYVTSFNAHAVFRISSGVISVFAGSATGKGHFASVLFIV